MARILDFRLILKLRCLKKSSKFLRYLYTEIFTKSLRNHSKSYEIFRNLTQSSKSLHHRNFDKNQQKSCFFAHQKFSGKSFEIFTKSFEIFTKSCKSYEILQNLTKSFSKISNLRKLRTRFSRCPPSQCLGLRSSDKDVQRHM